VVEAGVDQDTEATDQDQGSEDQDQDPGEEVEVDTDPEEVGADIDQEEVKVETEEVEAKVKEDEVNLAVSLEVGEIEVTTKIPSLRSRRKYQECERKPKGWKRRERLYPEKRPNFCRILRLKIMILQEMLKVEMNFPASTT